MKPGCVDLNVKKLHQSVVKDLLKGTQNEEKFKKSAYPAGSRRPLSRKEKRKVTREFKKAKNVAHNRGVMLAEVLPQYVHTRADLLEGAKNKKTKKKKKKKTKSSAPADKESPVEPESGENDRQSNEEKPKKLKEADRQRRKQQRKLIKEDDKEIRKYAKKLGLTKRKSKNLPESFKAEGLDYLLELIDRDTTGDVVDSNSDRADKDSPDDVWLDVGEEDEGDEEDLEEEESEADDEEWDSDEEKPEEMPTSKRRTHGQAEPLKKKVKFADKQSSDEESEKDEEMEVAISGAKRRSQPEEDIYGRVKNSEGNFSLQSDPATRMSLLRELDERANQDDKTAFTVKRLVKGVVNRLSESNVVSIVSQISGFFQAYNRSLVRTMLTDCLLSSCLKEEVLPQRLLLEHSLLMAILFHSKEHSDQVCHMVEALVVKISDLYKQESTVGISEEPDKKVNNGLTLLAHLYSLKVVGSKLILDFLKLMIGNFSNRDVELLLSFVKDVGFVLRKDDPAALRQIITDVHKRVNSEDSEKLREDSRVKFMLETLSAIKNNNIFKVLSYDPAMMEHFQKFLRGCVKGSLETPLAMGLPDYLETETKGRWWIVGASWQNPTSGRTRIFLL